MALIGLLLLTTIFVGMGVFAFQSNVPADMKAGKFDRAIRTLRRLLKFSQNNPTTWLRLAECLMETRQYGEAISAFQRVMALDPSRSNQILLEVAKAYQKQGKTKEAAETIEKYIRLKPFQTTGYIRLAEVYRASGDYEKGLEAAEKALAIDPHSEQAREVRNTIRELRLS